MSDEINKVQANQHKRLLKNAFFSALSWFLPIVLTIFGTPIIVKGLGYEQYGLYALILTFISYSFSFGIGRIVTKYVSEYISQGKNSQIRELISTTFWVSLLFCFTGCAFILVFSESIVKNVLQISSDFQAAAKNGLYIACASICFMMVAQVFQSVLQAIHRFDQVSVLITFNGFLLTIGNILLVVFGFGINSLLLWNLITGVLNCILYYLAAKKQLPEFGINFSIHADTAKLVLSYSFGLVGYQIFSNILLIFERSWITRNLGAESLTFYVVPMTIALYLHAFISSIVVVVFPLMSELQSEPDKLLKLYQRATKVIFLIIAGVGLTIFCASNLFLTLWINREFAENTTNILILHTLSFSIFGSLAIIWQLAEGFGRPRFNALISFIWLLVSIPLMVVLVGNYKTEGIALSRLTGNLVTLPFIWLGERLFLRKISWRFWGKLFLSIGIAGLFSVITETVIFNKLPASWLTLFVGSGSGLLTYAVIVWALKVFSEDEVRFIKSIFIRK